MRCLAMASLFYDVETCLLRHCLPTDDVSCLTIPSCHNILSLDANSYSVGAYVELGRQLILSYLKIR
jgi:hypothetical protein